MTFRQRCVYVLWRSEALSAIRLRQQSVRKAIHKNYTLEEVIVYVRDCLENGFPSFRFRVSIEMLPFLISKKAGRHENKAASAAGAGEIMAHNRVKQYILKRNPPVPFLVDLGVMSEQGKVPPVLL